ncbi:hypothetical protein CPAR01_15885 [Colletotrichum paranaense]|uniref:Uncharacterized protein n=1 Tax=Colletotrichum paranaense TaxID=1914294 RepID=A0ABQ9RYX0_9PEZI|nr:uncharacterized protein CPAR01_15885 [Colletotrichum paranaense]KAK1518236.1 hypothetical protein CPAR01_15885 [Colletotrichum paranaense]
MHLRAGAGSTKSKFFTTLLSSINFNNHPSQARKDQCFGSQNGLLSHGQLREHFTRLINQVNISSSELPVYTFFGPTAGNQSCLFSVRAVVTNMVGKRASTGKNFLVRNVFPSVLLRLPTRGARNIMMTTAYPFNYVMPTESSSRTGVPLRRDEEGGGVGSLGSRHLTSVLSFSVPRSEVQGLRGRLG